MTQIPIPNEAITVTYAAVVSTSGPFVVPFTFLKEQDVVAIVTDALLVETVLVWNTDFTFTTLDAPVGQEGNGYTGGEITLVVPIGADLNSSIQILRSTIIERTNNYPNTGPFQMPLLNDEQNNHIAIMQELANGQAGGPFPQGDLQGVTDLGNSTDQGIDLILGASLTVQDVGATQLLTISQTSNPATINTTGAGINFTGASSEYHFNTGVRAVGYFNAQSNGYVSSTNGLGTERVQLRHDDTWGWVETNGPVAPLRLSSNVGAVYADDILAILGDINTPSPPGVQVFNGRFEIWDNDGTTRLFDMGFTNSNDLIIESLFNGGFITMLMKDAANNAETLLFGDPDGDTNLNANNELHLQYRNTDRVDVGTNEIRFLRSIKIAESATGSLDGDTLGYGQLWVRDDTTLMYTDEVGGDAVLTGAAAPTTGSFTIDFDVGTSDSNVVTIIWQRVGDVVHMTMPAANFGNADANTLGTGADWPVGLRPASTRYGATMITENSAEQVWANFILTSAGVVTFQAPNAGDAGDYIATGFSAAGVKGVNGGWSWTYRITDS